VAHPVLVLARKPQVDRQRLAVGEQAAHRRRVRVAPAGGERINPCLGLLDGVEAGLDAFGEVKDRPVVGFDLDLGVLGYLGQDMRATWFKQRWRSAPPMVRSTAPISPGALSEITNSGQSSPRSPSPVRKPSQASPDSLQAPSNPTNTGLSSVSMPRAASTGSAEALAWYLK